MSSSAAIREQLTSCQTEEKRAGGEHQVTEATDGPHDLRRSGRRGRRLRVNSACPGSPVREKVVSFLPAVPGRTEGGVATVAVAAALSAPAVRLSVLPFHGDLLSPGRPACPGPPGIQDPVVHFLHFPPSPPVLLLPPGV